MLLVKKLNAKIHYYEIICKFVSYLPRTILANALFFQEDSYLCSVIFHNRTMTIAVDFDGTIVEHRYPHIGKEIPFAIDTLKLLQQEQHKLILWSVREGELLKEAVAWCKERGLEFYAINRDYPEEKQLDKGFSRKLKVDLFIDDRNLGGLPDWNIIYRTIKEHKTFQDIYTQINNS